MRVFFVAWIAYATALLTSSRDLFTQSVHEEGDAGTVSILVLSAKHFDLLVGNYSRVGFHHPGPSFVYVQAFGEWLFHDLLHWVPTPWNGQAIAILLLNAALVALALSVIHSWYPSWPLIAGIGGASLLFVTVYRDLLSGLWMPYVYFAPFLLLLVAVTSVVAGRTEHLWVLALAGGLLIHGHAEFLFFVPLLGGAALFLIWRRKVEVAKRDWWLFGIIAAAFASTIVLDGIVHFPGELAKYAIYGGGHGIHAPWTAAWYTVQFWGPNRILGIVILLVLFALVAKFARGEEFLRSGLRVCAAALLLMAIYAMIGIDQINEPYIGYFSYAIPLFMFALLLIELNRRIAELEFTGAAALRYAGVALLVIGLVVSGLTHSLANRRPGTVGLDTTLDAMTKVAGTRPIVLERKPHEAWGDVVFLVLAGARSGTRVCADEAKRMELLVTAEYVCTPAELATGAHFVVTRKESGPPAGQVIGILGRTDTSLSWVSTLG